MTKETPEDDYSDEDYEDSDEEQKIGPFGRTTQANKNGESTLPKKERIKRRGQIPLNMTKNYGRKSGWGSREGFRELIQNFADNVRENPDGSLRMVDWVFEKTDDDRVHTFLAYAQGTKPKLNEQTGLHDRENALGYITLRNDKHTFILVNKNTRLSRRVWSMGETSKGGQGYHIGGHGEGMKVGIIGLLREGFKVNYYTNKEIWNWRFQDYKEPSGGVVSDLLTIELSPYQPRKARVDPLISDDVREAQRVANKDTTVIVEGKRKFDINFNNYLFLVNPPSATLFKTSLGTILTGDEYKSKIFVKGIFVEKRGIKNPPVLAFGVDFNKVALDRDRRSLMTGSQVALTLAEMWNTLISEDEGTSAERYLKLMLSEDDYLETLKAKECISRVVAEKLFEKLRSSFSVEAFFYNREDTDVSETLRIIHECLARVPEAIPRKLYNIFLKYKLIATAEEERMSLFSHAPIATPDILDPWIKQTLHAFESALQIHPRLKECSYIFREAPDSVSIDITRVRPTRFEFHHRWVDYGYVHKQRKTCPLFQSKNEIENQNESSICYCAVEELMNLILPEIENLSATDKRQIERSYIDLLMIMPRDVSVTPKKDEKGNILAEFNWKISATNYFGSFDVLIFAEDYGDSPRKEHRYHCMPAVVAPTSTNNLSITSSADLNPRTSSPDQSPIDSSSAFGISCPKSPLESVTQAGEFLWQGKASHSTSFVLDSSTTGPIVPGNKFVALIRPALDNGCFYSSPTPFILPCPSPQKVEAKKLNCRITVSWEFLYPIVAKFQVVMCQSSYDISYISGFVSGRSHSFNIDDDLLTNELDITVQAESDAGIRSEKIEATFPAESIESTSPSLESMCDYEDPASPVDMSATSRIQSPDTPIDSPPKSSRTSQLPPRLRLNSESLLSEVISVEEVSEKSFEENYDEDDMDEDELDSPNEAEYDHCDNMGLFSEDYTFAQPFSTPSSEPTPSDEELAVLNSAIAPDFGTIESGKTYHVVTQPGGAYVIHVHQIRRNSQELDLVVSIYAFINSLFRELPENATGEQRGRLILFYTNWTKCGEIGDAMHLPLNNVVRVVESCRVQHPQQGPVSLDVSTTESERPTSSSERFYLVEWATACQDWKSQASSSETRSLIELRSLYNKADYVELNSSDWEKLSYPCTVHDYNCGIGGSTVGFKALGFDVQIAVDPEGSAIESWKKNHNSGSTFCENLDKFLDEYPQRVRDGVLRTPTILSMSNLLRSESNNCCGSDNPYNAKCDSFKRILRAATLVNSPVIMSHHDPKLFRSNVHHSECWETLFKGLLELGYEFRATMYQACDYGPVIHQSRLILVASKIGFPAILDNLAVPTVKERLQRQGFKEDYRLVGDKDTQIRQLEETLPPPLLIGIASSWGPHIHAVKTTVAELQTQESVINVNKRKRDEDTSSDSLKKVRWREKSSGE